MGADGHTHCSNKATIWRWRNAFQNDFAARMQWTMIKYWCKTNHHPVVIVNGHGGLSPIFVEADAGSTITFDTSGTYDPDGDGRSINWFQYKEPSVTLTYHAINDVTDLGIKIIGNEGKKVEVSIPSADKSCYFRREKRHLENGVLLHLLPEVTDAGTPALTTYRRILIQPIDQEFNGRA